MNANAICYKCGTAQENPDNGYCINGHDNWLEIIDDSKRLGRAAKKFGITVEKLAEHIEHNKSINL